MVLYSLRHGGASWDALRRARDMLGIKRRGRWRSDASLRRYEKAARAQKEVQRMSRATLNFAAAVEADLERIVLGQSRPPPLP